MRVRELQRRLAARGVDATEATDRADLGILLVRSLQAERDAALAALADQQAQAQAEAQAEAGGPARREASSAAARDDADHHVVPAEVRLMRVGELKRRLQAMGVSLVGVTERRELVHLLAARMAAEAGAQVQVQAPPPVAREPEPAPRRARGGVVRGLRTTVARHRQPGEEADEEEEVADKEEEEEKKEEALGRDETRSSLRPSVASAAPPAAPPRPVPSWSSEGGGEVPLEVLRMHVLPRLDGKSLARSCGVSRTWLGAADEAPLWRGVLASDLGVGEAALEDPDGVFRVGAVRGGAGRRAREAYGTATRLDRAWRDRTFGTHPLHGHTWNVECLAVLNLAGERCLLSGSWDGSLLVWSAARKRALAALKEHGDWVSCLVVCRRHVVSGSSDGTAKVWDRRVVAGVVSSQRFGTVPSVHTLSHEGAAVTCGAAVDGRRAATGDVEGTARVWDLASGHCVASVPSLHAGPLWQLRLAPPTTAAGGRPLVFSSGRDGAMCLWGPDPDPDLAAKGAPQQKQAAAVLLRAHAGSPLLCMDVAEVGGWGGWGPAAVAATGGADASVQLWLHDAGGLAREDGTPGLVEGGAVHGLHQRRGVLCLAWAPWHQTRQGDGRRWLATGGGDASVRVLSVRRQGPAALAIQCVAHLTTHTRPVSSLVVDRCRLVTASPGEGVHVHMLDPPGSAIDRDAQGQGQGRPPRKFQGDGDVRLTHIAMALDGSDHPGFTSCCHFTDDLLAIGTRQGFIILQHYALPGVLQAGSRAHP